MHPVWIAGRRTRASGVSQVLCCSLEWQGRREILFQEVRHSHICGIFISLARSQWAFIVCEKILFTLLRASYSTPESFLIVVHILFTRSRMFSLYHPLCPYLYWFFFFLCVCVCCKYIQRVLPTDTSGFLSLPINCWAFLFASYQRLIFYFTLVFFFPHSEIVTLVYSDKWISGCNYLQEWMQGSGPAVNQIEITSTNCLARNYILTISVPRLEAMIERFMSDVTF